MVPSKGGELVAKRDEVFRGAMATLGLTFGRDPLPLLDAYWEVLSCLTDTEMSRAFSRALTECRFFPVPVELLTFAGRGPRSLLAEAGEAWEAVRAAMDLHDYTTSVDFGPLVNAVVRNLGGWVWLCGQTVPDLVWRRKDFERVYVEFAPKPAEQLRGDPLRGAFGGTPARVSIGGVTPKRALPLVLTQASVLAKDVVRELANAKSKGDVA